MRGQSYDWLWHADGKRVVVDGLGVEQITVALRQRHFCVWSPSVFVWYVLVLAFSPHGFSGGPGGVMPGHTPRLHLRPARGEVGTTIF